MFERFFYGNINPLFRVSIKLIWNFILQNIEIIIFLALVFYKIQLFNRVLGLNYLNDLFILTSAGSVLVMLSFGLWFGRKARIALLFTLNLFITLVIISDLIYFRYFNDVISVPVFSQVVLVDSIKSSIISLFRRIDILFIADIIILIPIILYMLKDKKIRDQDMRGRAISAVLVLFIGIVLIGQGFFKINVLQGNRLFSHIFDRVYIVENTGVINFHGFDAYYNLFYKSFSKKVITDSEKNALKEVFAKKTGERKVPALKGKARGLNLIVVQVEALQNLVVGMKIGNSEVTPNLNSIIKRSIYFNNYYSQTDQGSTSDAEFLSNVSYYPLPGGSVYFKYSNNAFESLPKVLRKKGYGTYAMHPYKASFWNRAAVYPVLGFDRFYDVRDYVIDEKVGWGLSDKSFFIQSLEKIKRLKEPFYTFMITLSSHHPYDAFKDYNEFHAGSYENTFYGNYLKAMHYADKALGLFIGELERSGLMERSVLVIYGDHPALQKERLDDIKEYIGLHKERELAWLDMLKVPLVIHLPGDEESGVRTVTGGQVDLFPTLANLLDISARYCLGKDLLNTKESYAIFRDGSITDGKRVYLKKSGVCLDTESGEKLGRDIMNDYMDIARQKLEISDKVLQNDLIRFFESEK